MSAWVLTPLLRIRAKWRSWTWIAALIVEPTSRRESVELERGDEEPSYLKEARMVK